MPISRIKAGQYYYNLIFNVLTIFLKNGNFALRIGPDVKGRPANETEFQSQTAALFGNPGWLPLRSLRRQIESFFSW
jgi:hypothetical protein